MPFDFWRPVNLVNTGFALERARQARREALKDLPAGATGSRSAPWNAPKVIMGLGIIIGVPGIFFAPIIGLIGAALFAVGLVAAIVAAIIDTVRSQ